VTIPGILGGVSDNRQGKGARIQDDYNSLVEGTNQKSRPKVNQKRSGLGGDRLWEAYITFLRRRLEAEREVGGEN